MDTDELRQFIVQKRELLSRETFSRRAFNRCENMSDEMKNRYVEYLIERLENAELDNRAMKLVLEDLTKELSRSHRMLEKLNESQSLLEEERKSRKSLEQEITKLKEQLKSARKQRFGSKKQSVKKDDSGSDDDPVDRENEKDGFDGTDESLDTRSIPESETQESHPSSPNPRDLCNRPETYRTMGVNGTPVRHLSDLSKVPGRILDRKLVRTFRLDIRLVEEQFEMVQYVEKGRKPRWGYFPKEGHPQVVTRFDGTKITPGFLQAIAYEVYVKNVTFCLLHQWLGDMGMTVSENTLRNWLKKGRKYLDRMVLELKRIALEKDAVVNCDETWCKVRKYDRYKKCYMWVLVNKAERVVIFFYEDGSRGRDVLTNFLGDAELKALMSDGYNAYVFIGDELKTHRYKDTDHQVCLAHVRAKFVKVLVIGHGDPCFANTLYNKSTKTLKFIDPKGAITEKELWTNPYYDIAKLSHSICGRYDFFNNGLFEIKVNAEFSYDLEIPFDNSGFIKIFKRKLEENGFDYLTVRIYEASLFLSMLPLHIDNPHKVFGFILNVKNILEEIKENV